MSFIKIIGLCTPLLLSGCGENSKPKISTEISALQKLVHISTPIKSVQWEEFCWPCDDSLLPSNPEFIALVAEFEPSDPKWFPATKEPIKETYIVRGSGKTWMSDPVKKILAADSVDSSKSNCTRYQSKLIATGKPVEGFICESGGRGLLYLILADYSEKT